MAEPRDRDSSPEGEVGAVNGSRSIRGVNLLYLSAFLALLVGSALMPPISLGWRVVVNEVFFLALPLGLYLLIGVRDVGGTLRLRGVSWQVAGLSVVIGLGLWRFDWWLGSALNQAVDYVIPLPPEMLNLSVFDRVAMVIGTVVLAPLVEGLLFWGALPSAYERGGPARVIAASALLFIAIHQELAQSVALVPVAVALGYVTWRSRSIVPAMLIHLANNGQAMLVSFLEGSGLRRTGFAPSGPGALAGAVVAGMAIWLLGRLIPAPGVAREKPRRGWLGRNWPLLPVAPIYTVLIALGVVLGARPEALASGQRVGLMPGPWKAETSWSYDVRNRLDEKVGQADCSLKPESDAFLLDCSMEQSAYEADAPSGFFREGAVVQRQTVRWDRETMALRGGLIEATFQDRSGEASLEARSQDGELTVRVSGTGRGGDRFGSCYDLREGERAGMRPPMEEPCRIDGAFLAGGGAPSPLMIGEWPWRLAALPFDLLYSGQVTLLWPYRSMEDLDGRAPAKEDVFVVVRTAEQVLTPAGEYVTWRVTIGERYTAWYTVDRPHHLVGFDDGMVHWELTELETR